MILPPMPFPAMTQPYCAWCDSFPCICERSEPCACGGGIDPNGMALVDALRNHQRTAQHERWRTENGL